MKVADLFAEIGFRPKKGDVKAMDKTIGRMRSALVALGGAFAVSKISGFINTVAASADSFAKMSRKVGISVEKLQQLEFASQISGTSIDVLRTGLQRFARTADDAAQGLTSAQEPFQRLGISTKDAGGQLKDLDTLLLEASDKIKDLPDGTAKTALAMKLFGRAGAELIPLLNEGSAGIEKLREEFAATGAQISSEDAKAFEDYNDTIHRVKTAIRGFMIQGVVAILPHLKAAATAVMGWVRANRELLRSGFKNFLKGVAVAMRALGKVLKTVFAVGKDVLEFVEQYISATDLLKAAMIGFAAIAVRSAIRTAIAWAAAAAPLLLMVAIIVAIGIVLEDLWQAFTGGESVLKDLHEEMVNVVVGWIEAVVGFWDWLKQSAKDTANAVADTLIDALDFIPGIGKDRIRDIERAGGIEQDITSALTLSEIAVGKARQAEREAKLRDLEAKVRALDAPVVTAQQVSSTSSTVGNTIGNMVINVTSADPREAGRNIMDALSRRFAGAK